MGAAVEVALAATALSAALICPIDRRAPAAGVGALANTARQSLLARSANATSAAG